MVLNGASIAVVDQDAGPLASRVAVTDYLRICARNGGHTIVVR